MTSLVPSIAEFLFGLGALILTYYVVINLFYLLVHVSAIFELRTKYRESQWTPPFRSFASPFYPGIAVVVPAYNESEIIIENVQSMLSLNYPKLEILVVNDGSTDDTVDKLRTHFDMEALGTEIPFDVPSEEIHDVYRSKSYEELLVVDKENGGKSDALNAGIWLTNMPLFCAVDADTVIDTDALLQLVRPFLEQPSTAVASGGVVRVANGCLIEDGLIQSINLPRTGLAGLQVMEYLRAFYSGRLGLSRLNGLVLISGAFGLFRTDNVQDIGGYRQDTVTEDFDLVVRLHRHLIDTNQEYTVDFIPEPVAWTEVPTSRGVLSRQRRRWYRGMVETVVTNRRMLFNRKYGRLGLFIFPFYIAAEMFGRLIEGFGYVLIPVAWYFGVLDFTFFLVFFLLTTGFGVFLSWFGIFSEVWSFNRYDSPWQVLRLHWYGLVENFGYRQWKAMIAWLALFEYLRGVKSWGVIKRRGFETNEGPSS